MDQLNSESFVQHTWTDRYMQGRVFDGWMVDVVWDYRLTILDDSGPWYRMKLTLKRLQQWTE